MPARGLHLNAKQLESVCVRLPHEIAFLDNLWQGTRVCTFMLRASVLRACFFVVVGAVQFSMHAKFSHNLQRGGLKLIDVLYMCALV